MNEKLIVSIHIPKTAGTTLAEVFSRTLHRRIIFDYDGYDNACEATNLIKDNSKFIEDYFRVLHGHFYAEKYLSVFPEAFFISVLRHPVDRVISQYMHEYNEDSEDAIYHSAIKEGRMDIIEFSEQPGIGDAMYCHLKGRDIDKYDLLLLSEDFSRSLAVFSASIVDLKLGSHFGLPYKLPKMNEGLARENRLQFDEKTRQEIFARTYIDNQVYSRGASLFDEKVRKYL